MAIAGSEDRGGHDEGAHQADRVCAEKCASDKPAAGPSRSPGPGAKGAAPGGGIEVMRSVDRAHVIRPVQPPALGAYGSPPRASRPDGENQTPGWELAVWVGVQPRSRWGAFPRCAVWLGLDQQGLSAKGVRALQPDPVLVQIVTPLTVEPAAFSKYIGWLKELPRTSKPLIDSPLSARNRTV